MNSYGALFGGIVGVIGGRKRPRLSADSTAIASCRPTLPAKDEVVKNPCGGPSPWAATRAGGEALGFSSTCAFAPS